MNLEYPDIHIHTSRRALILKKLGFQAMALRTKIDGKKKMFWVTHPMTLQEIKAKWPEKPTETVGFPIVGP